MQSGISASTELHSAFQTLVNDESSRFLLATITDESLVPLDTIASQSPSDFHADLALLAPHLKPNAALYILLRRSPSRFVAVSYVPDAAPVRQKMLFASTRLTLVRELGSEKFEEQVFATTADELTAEGWQRHEAHVAGEQPLTQEEQDLQGIKEAEAQESGGTGARRVQTSGHLSMRVDEGVVKALEGLKDEGKDENLVQLKIDVPTETITLVSATAGCTAAALSTSIAADEPRYSFYRHKTDAGAAPILFIYTCPGTSKVKERMVYAASRGFVVSLAETTAELPIAKRLEFTSPEDIGPDAIDEEFAPKEEKKTGFAKPKRPGRR
ncbi:twinfilin-1 [Phyllosticta citrichinensis]|uniref:Twinfilin-1 n=1 Tax=Phyllosticta citrichinensis TaxID=1130410 RepID=A0ABR1XK14_9PEZI